MSARRLTIKETFAAIDKRAISLTCFTAFCSNYSRLYATPFVPSMVKHFGYREEDKGYYAGLILSSVSFGGAVAGYPLGWLSDRIGRRPVIVSTLVLCSILELIFGFSGSEAWAIIIRFFTGMANSTAPVQLAIAFDVSEESTQGVCLILLSAFSGIGTFCGPSLAGYMAEPADKYPGIFPVSGAFVVHPFLLPCLVSSCVIMICAILNLFCLNETRWNKSGQKESWNLCCYKDDQNKKLLSSKTQEDRGSTRVSCCDRNICRLFRSRQVLVSVVLVALYTATVVGVEDLVTIWSSTDTSLGGLSYTTSKIGTVIGSAALPLFTISPFLYPFLASRIGVIRVQQLAVGIQIAVSATVCSYRYLWNWPLGQQIFLSVTMGIFALCSISGYASFSTYVTNSVHPSDVGSATGIGFTCGTIGSGLSPMTGGAIFAWSITGGAVIGFPFDVNFVFLLFSFCFLLINCISVLLPESVQRQRSV